MKSLHAPRYIFITTCIALGIVGLSFVASLLFFHSYTNTPTEVYKAKYGNQLLSISSCSYGCFGQRAWEIYQNAIISYSPGNDNNTHLGRTRIKRISSQEYTTLATIAEKLPDDPLSSCYKPPAPPPGKNVIENVGGCYDGDGLTIKIGGCSISVDSCNEYGRGSIAPTFLYTLNEVLGVSRFNYSRSDNIAEVFIPKQFGSRTYNFLTSFALVALGLLNVMLAGIIILIRRIQQKTPLVTDVMNKRDIFWKRYLHVSSIITIGFVIGSVIINWL